MIIRQLQEHVNQCDETPVEVIHDDRPAGSQSYMWVHLTGELSPGAEIIVYEYQKTWYSDHPKQYYRNFRGVLMTDGLEQYHKLARESEGITNANCGAYAVCPAHCETPLCQCHQGDRQGKLGDGQILGGIQSTDADRGHI